MSFQPVVPFNGLGGYAFLQRTRESQEEAFVKSPEIARSTAAFKEKIAGVTSAEALVKDRQLLRVALGAFGLDEDINNRFFIRKVLEDGTTSREALANRLSDKRYLAFAQAFGFGDQGGGRTAEPGFAGRIIARFEERQFEIAVGDVNPDLRLVLGFGREMADLVGRTRTNDARWFSVLAAPPLRAVFERALGLPNSVGAIDLDQQLTIFKDRAEARLGTSEISELIGEEKQKEMVRSFLASSEVNGIASPTVRGSAALALLTAAAGPRLF